MLCPLPCNVSNSTQFNCTECRNDGGSSLGLGAPSTTSSCLSESKKGDFTAQIASPTSSMQPNAVQAPDQKPSESNQKAESHSINSSSEPLNDEKPNENHQISYTRSGTSEGENFVPIN
ncbi:hypothetical protein BY996DRAFT_6409189 [Phakopsora pachyrhizi]|nr:hypothetical protein BY996DRAFT_6409189 [Phakopsora pachyrhizi]